MKFAIERMKIKEKQANKKKIKHG